MPKSTGDEWVGAPEAARRLGVYLTSLYKVIDQGGPPAYKIGRVIRIRRADLDDFLERSRVRGGDLVHLYSPRPRRVRRLSARSR